MPIIKIDHKTVFHLKKHTLDNWVLREIDSGDILDSWFDSIMH